LELENTHYELGQQQEKLEQEQDKELGTWNLELETRLYELRQQQEKLEPERDKELGT
jgi:hypothetical protein